MEKNKETKRFDLMEFGSALGREEMKKLMAGSEGDCCGNIYCDIGGEQWYCGSGYGGGVMTTCLNNCELEAILQDTTCNGCARFPE
ncbi:MAG: hypothetical protein WDZ29_07200 [Balneolaceae bacterium]